jgi:biopolymer transport protein ExbD
MRTVLLGTCLLAATAAHLAAQPQPVALKGAPGRWTLNGHAVPDDVLPVRLRELFEIRRDKRLHFATAAGVSYGQAVQAMGVAWSAGVEELALLSDEGPMREAVVVSNLVALSGLDTDLRLPVTDGYGTDRAATDVAITARASGAEPDGLARASGAARVLLRADAGLTYGDVLQALRQAKARGARALSLAVQKPEGPGELKRRCDAGQARDCGTLGAMYLYGFGGAPKAPATGVNLLRKGCGAGERQGCEALALALWEGESVQMNRDEAAKLLTDNCRAGLQTSCTYLQGAGLPVPQTR